MNGDLNDHFFFFPGVGVGNKKIYICDQAADVRKTS